MDDTAALIPGAHRSIRWLDGQEAAFTGELVTDGERQRLRLDAGELAEPLWSFASAEHVAGVRDVVRRHDGQDALLPWCAEPVDVFLGRRAAAERPLLPGEIVTLVGSVLRGSAEVMATGDASESTTVRGRWWLDDEARPLFVPGEGAACTAVGVELIERVREGCGDRAVNRMLAEIITGMADPRVVLRSIDRWERELTELAAPRALDREVYPPERVSTIELHRALLPDDARRVNAQRSVRSVLTQRWTQTMEWLRTHHPRREARSTKHRPPTRPARGRMLLVGAGMAGLVLLGGMLWPSGDADSSAATVEGDVAAPRTETSRPAQTPASEPSPPVAPAVPPSAAPSVAPTAPVPNEGELMEKAVALLLTEIASCARAEDVRCEEAVVDGAGQSVRERLAGAEATREITPIEEYGDIAVIRLGPSGEHGEQMLVLVRQKDGWLVRDVYDVADQPSGGS